MNTGLLIAYGAALCGGGLAAFGAYRARKSTVWLAFACTTAALAAEALVTGLSFPSTDPAAFRRWQTWRLILTCCAIGTGWIFSRTYVRGNQPSHSRRNRIALIAALVVPPALALTNGDLIATAVRTHAPVMWLLRFGWVGYVLHVAFLAGAIAIVLNLERTFRAAIGTVRWRIKFMLLGLAVVFATQMYTASEVLLFHGSALALEIVNCGALVIATPLIAWSLLRTGRVEIDVYPSGAALRNSLTLLLAGIYLVVIGVFAKVVTFLGGDAAFSLKAFVVLLAIVGLAVALQSNRVHWQLRRFVSHHFQRPLHDYAAIWEKFTHMTSARVDEEDLCRAISALVADVFDVLSVRIWLCNDRKDALRLAGATSGSATARGIRTITPAADVLARFARHPDAIDLEARGNEPWRARLRDAHPSDFPHGGHRICVPMFGRSELVGILTLGDRVCGSDYTVQDYELLTCLASHAAASLLNAQLSTQLLQAKQLEAFQTMAAFFVHDLKNTASTLNLTLRNLPVHFDDPEFRADALRGIAKSADHINDLINRLTALRSELRIRPVDSDLNDVVGRALAKFGPIAPTLIRDLQPVPLIPIDCEQVERVVTNLVLNASEATPSGGRIRISTRYQNGWAILAVDDNGCGMTEDFIADSLFRPFKTSKKSGLGIGMFQSKMIIEAHGGRISVASRPGDGTRFEVFLRGASAAESPETLCSSEAREPAAATA